MYKGLGVVVIGIIFKMVIRFSFYEFYRILLVNKELGIVFIGNIFVVGVGVGIIEVVFVVNSMEVVKIRL